MTPGSGVRRASPAQEPGLYPDRCHLAYTVSEQTHEIGVRIALGARGADVMSIVFRRGMFATTAGAAAGLTLAFALARVLSSLVFGVSASDPATFAGIPLALTAAALAATWIPARRAVRIDPIVALRYE
jgi:putative ABC transport system permease protein